MRKRQNAVLDALLRAVQFLIENAALLIGVDLTAARQRLDAVVASFNAHAFDQDLGGRKALGETSKQRQLRMKLRQEQMEPIALIARRNLRDVPEFAALQMPKPSVRGQAFLASANGMAEAATIHHDTLIAHGLPATFLDDFKASVAKLASSLSTRDTSRTKRVAATKGLAVEEKNGRMVLSILDSLVQQAAGGNQSLLRAWQAARLIHRGTSSTGDSAATSTPAPAAPATPATPAAPATPQPVTAPAQTPAGTAATTPTPAPVDAATPPAAA